MEVYLLKELFTFAYSIKNFDNFKYIEN